MELFYKLVTTRCIYNISFINFFFFLVVLSYFGGTLMGVGKDKPVIVTLAPNGGLLEL
jgi:hypothetical protein